MAPSARADMTTAVTVPSAIDSVSRSKLQPLTSMRFVAAAYVAFHHFALLTGIYPPMQWANMFLGLGYISVNFFFILSGFVLAWNYIDTDGRFRVTRRAFWIARFARLYPAYALALLFALPKFVDFATGEAAPAQGIPPMDNPWVVAATVVTTPLLLQDWFGLLAWNAVGWSLSVEAFFYLTFPWLAPRVGRASERSLKALVLVCALVPIAVVFLVFGGRLQGAHSAAAWYEVSDLLEAFFYASPVIHWPEFVLGVVIGRLFQRRSLDGRIHNWQPWFEYLAVGGTILLLLLLARLPGPIFIAVMAPVCAWLIFSLAHSRSGLSQVLSSPVLILLGNASYSVYLFHATAIYAFIALAHRLGTPWMMSWPAFGLGFLLIVAFTIAVFEWVEEPARDWIRQRLLPSPA